MPSPKWFPIEVPDFPYDVVALEGSTNGRTIIAGIKITVREGVGPKAPYDQITRDTLSKLSMSFVKKALAEAVGEDDWALPVIEPGKLTDDDYHWIAVVFTTAMEAGEPPNKKIAELFNTNPNTARSWVRRAKERGYIDPELRPRSGRRPRPTAPPQQ